MSDYLRTVSNKTKWGAEGTLLPQSLDEWDANLLSRHAAICDGFEATLGHLDEVKRGAAIYAECRKLSVALQGKTVPDHFTHGCLNELSDDRQIGWHPNFKDLLD
ncbi:ABC-three component system protein [Lysobacter gummosus]|uniref:ABC-three component system protein n=1 Tax=Lysobacter gummosus TaxID=262324 RepID=UPI003640743D